MITEYINRVGQNIVLNSDAKIPFTIRVIDSDEVNAFALPGGYFYVNKGLIVAAENEAELAGVMAHEVAHVAARHAMENAGKGQLLNYGLIAGIIFSGGITSAILQNTAGLDRHWPSLILAAARREKPICSAFSIYTLPVTIHKEWRRCLKNWHREIRKSRGHCRNYFLRIPSRSTVATRVLLWLPNSLRRKST